MREDLAFDRFPWIPLGGGFLGVVLVGLLLILLALHFFFHFHLSNPLHVQRHPRQSADPHVRPGRLRQRQVLALLAEGTPAREIAARLGISENTVKYHIRNILDRLHAKSRTELAGRAARQALR